MENIDEMQDLIFNSGRKKTLVNATRDGLTSLEFYTDITLGTKKIIYLQK